MEEAVEPCCPCFHHSLHLELHLEIGVNETWILATDTHSPFSTSMLLLIEGYGNV
jgi:hypothetical protein